MDIKRVAETIIGGAQWIDGFIRDVIDSKLPTIAAIIVLIFVGFWLIGGAPDRGSPNNEHGGAV